MAIGMPGVRLAVTVGPNQSQLQLVNGATSSRTEGRPPTKVAPGSMEHSAAPAPPVRRHITPTVLPPTGARFNVQAAHLAPTDGWTLVAEVDRHPHIRLPDAVNRYRNRRRLLLLDG